MPDTTLRKSHRAGDADSVAAYSPCERYRYELTRIWHPGGKRILFIMLNPSTATEVLNDPSVGRCERRARAMGFGSFTVCNLFGWRSTDPKALKKVPDPNGPGNDEAISRCALAAFKIVCAWGTHGSHMGRGGIVERRLRMAGFELHHLGLTAEGHPKHPLYLGYSIQPAPWRSWASARSLSGLD